MYLSDKEKEGQRLKALPPFIEKIKEISIEEKIPLLEDVIAEFLLFYLSDITASEIVEIGTGLGYSAALFSHIFPQGHIETVEKEDDLAKRASQFLPENVKVFSMDAQEYFAQRDKYIDILFLDGAKSHYQEIFHSALPFLRKGSLILSDNIFARGITFDPNPKRKLKTIHRGMNSFLKEMMEKYNSYLLPLGDGLLITRYDED